MSLKGCRRLGGEEKHFGFWVFPGIGGQARLVGAAIGEELLFAPARFLGHLWQETAGEVTLFYVYAIDAETKGKWVGGFFNGDRTDISISSWAGRRG